MLTLSQIYANRMNAQSSTGPKTDAGKAKMRLNPTRHGLAASVLIIAGESAEEFDELYLDLLVEHEPFTTTEELLVYKLAEQFWFSRRAGGLMAKATDDKRLALMIRYQGAADRMFLKFLNELRKLQKERKLEEIGSASQTSKTPPVEIPRPAPKTPAAHRTEPRNEEENTEPPQKEAA